MASIFGLGEPKFTGTGDPDSNTVNLDNTILTPQLLEVDEAELVSVINGVKTFVSKADYATFVVYINLHKYGAPATKFNTLLSYLHKDVVFYIFRDGAASGDGLGKAIKDSSNNNVPFHFAKMDWQYLDNYYFYDVLELTFTATKSIDITKSVQ